MYKGDKGILVAICTGRPVTRDQLQKPASCNTISPKRSVSGLGFGVTRV